MTYLAALGAALAAVPVGLAVLTGTGARRRGGTVPLALLAAVFFPVAWVVWYVRDERPWTA